MIRVLVVDDHSVVREGLCRLLDSERGIEVLGQTGSGREAVKLCKQLKPDLVLLDYSLPDIDGLETTSQIVPLKTGAKILILTMYANEEYAIRLIRAGAAGFVIKGASPEELLTAVRKVARGGTYISPAILEKMVGRMGKSEKETPEANLSDREIQVLVRLARGATTREVAEELHLSVSTIETYRSRILEKLNLRNNSDLTRFAIRRRLIDLD
ncbi:MAG: response regulator transcription factor [Deltaproteobacteria bacterium]|nr:response regulator transcription factor [Deltaproteobacteria bacterium]